MCRLQAAAGRQRGHIGNNVWSKRSRWPQFQEKPKKSYDAFASATRRRDSAGIKSRAASLGVSQTLQDLSHSLRAVCLCDCGMTREHSTDFGRGQRVVRRDDTACDVDKEDAAFVVISAPGKGDQALRAQMRGSGRLWRRKTNPPALDFSFDPAA
jgi:hypothetical protein